MSFKAYKKKCIKCQYISDIPSDWFDNELKTKPFTCPSCRHTALLKVALIRKKIYNDFLEETQLVGGNITSNSKSNYFLKVTHYEDRGFYEILKEARSIQIGRGSELVFNNPEKDDKVNYRLTIPDRYISKKHALISVSDFQNQRLLMLKDLNSTNGTIYKGEKLDCDDEVILEADSIIKIGETEIEIIS